MTAQPHATAGMPTVGYGDRIRLIRRDLDLTVVEMAAEIGTTYGTLGRHELMRNKPQRNTRMIANSIELRYGTRWPGGLAHWVLEGHAMGDQPDTCPECAARDSNPEPAGKGPVILAFRRAAA